MADNRKKGCPNEACEMNKKKIKWKSSDEFCSKCGAKLVFVCAKCFCEIEDIDEKHRICVRCQEKVEEKKEKAVDAVKAGAKKAGGAVVAGAGVVAAGVAAKVGKEAKNVAVNKGADIIKAAAKAVFKI